MAQGGNQSTSTTTTKSSQAPITNNHYLLPLPHDKYAPKTLQSTARPREIKHFLEVYEHLCSFHGITDDAEKCKGIVNYCTSKVAGLIERTPAYTKGDFGQLIKDIKYFIDNDDDTYSLTQLEFLTVRGVKPAYFLIL